MWTNAFLTIPLFNDPVYAGRLVRENPKSVYIHSILGSLYFYTNNFKEAKEEFKIALQIDKENIFAKEILKETEKILDIHK